MKKNLIPAGTVEVAKETKRKSASQKISVIAIAAACAAIVTIAVAVIVTVAGSMTAMTNQAFSSISRGNATQVREVLGAADNAAILLQDYLTTSFIEESKNGGGNAITRVSRVYSDIKIGTFEKHPELLPVLHPGKSVTFTSFVEIIDNLK